MDTATGEKKKRRVIGRHACERCRKAKIRCLPTTTTPQDTNGKCRKCFVGNLDCEWKEISKTRNRKRTDVRVGELERRIAELSTALSLNEKTNDGLSLGERSSVGRDKRRRRQDEEDEDGVSVLVSVTDAVSSNHSDGHPASVLPIDSRDESLNPASGWPSVSSHQQSLPSSNFSADRKAQLVETFVTTMLPQYPIVALLEPLSTSHLEASRPFTTNAIITAACSTMEPRLFRAIYESTVTALSQAVVVEGRKSLDLIQALLITATWACPPHDLSRLKIYQLSHMACTMALELGLGGRTSLQAQAQSVDDFATNASEAMVEKYRTMFGVYLTCSRLAVSFRHQKMVSFSSSTNAIIDLFLRYTQSVNDRRLVAWLRLQSIAEDIESMKQNAEMRLDPSAIAQASSSRNEFSSLQDRLKSWEASLDVILWNESLKIDFALCKSKLHELAICFGKNMVVDQLDLSALATRAPPSVVSRRDQRKSTMSPSYARALLSFISGCQSILDTFLHTDPKTTIRTLPVLTMFRIPFAFKALAMLRARIRDPEDAMCLVIDDETLAWHHYSTSVMKVLDIAAGGGPEDRLYVCPAMVLRIRDSMMVKGPKAVTAAAAADVPDIMISNPTVTDDRPRNDNNNNYWIDDTNYDFVNDLFMPFFSSSSSSLAQGDDDVWSASASATAFMDFDSYSL